MYLRTVGEEDGRAEGSKVARQLGNSVPYCSHVTSSAEAESGSRDNLI